MDKRLKQFCVMLIALWSFAIMASAQSTLDVSSFTRQDQDLTARVTKPVRDNDEGKLCALIRVETTLSDLDFRADALGIVAKEKHAGEYWIYVPYGAKMISFYREGSLPMMYQYQEEIESGVVYKLVLKSYESMDTGAMASANSQMFVLTHNPDEASVYIDGMEVKTENGVFAAMLTKGHHTYEVKADQYEGVSGEFDLAGEPVRETAILKAKFGFLDLFTLPVQGFDVIINGEQAGKSPYKSGRLEPGSYSVRFEKEKYYPIDTVLNVTAGETTQATIKLTSKEDSLFYNRLMGGKKFAFGVNAGYLIPNVSASSSGEYCGSPVNYLLNDERENANYTSATGFTFGVHADMRIYKNFYFTAGLNFTQYKYDNKFEQHMENQTKKGNNNSSVFVGDVNNSFKEKYTFSTIDIPLLLSYRFVTSKYSQLMVNLGPVISYGLSAKLNLSGSEEGTYKLYSIYAGQIDYSRDYGTESSNTHTNANIDLYEKSARYNKTNDNGAAIGTEYECKFKESAFKKLNYGLQLGVGYEMRGFQLTLNYNLMLSNMANSAYWEGDRMPIFDGKTGNNAMPGYNHKIHSLQIKLGYTFRY